MTVRAVTAITAVVLLASAACSSDTPTTKPSSNVSRWKAGNAVVVLVADVRPGSVADVSSLGTRPGVIAVSSTSGTVRLSLSRQAMLVDLAALTLELQRTPGLSNVRQTVVPPG